MEKFLLIDSHSLLYRAYYAFPFLSSIKNEKDNANAVYGFFLMLIKALKRINPDFAAAAFDSAGPTFRHKEYKEYKAKRAPCPKDLSCQIEEAKRILNKLKIPFFEKKGYEADDIIGTITSLIRSASFNKRTELEVIILSSDLDLLQLVEEKVKLWTLKPDKFYDLRAVEERYGLKPCQLLDFRGLKGDPSDNIPGIPGIGEKTATALLKAAGSLEKLYSSIEKGESVPASPKIIEKLKKHKNQAFLFKEISRIEKDVAVDFNLEECWLREENKRIWPWVFQEEGFFSLSAEIKKQQTLGLA